MPSSTNSGEVLVRKRLSRSTKIKVIIAGIAIAAALIYCIYDIIFHGPITSLLSNRDQLVATVESFGIFAPLLYILLQILQTVVAPIPGQLVGSVGGFLFGFWGILWTLIGSIIGCFLVFRISRRFGRPLLERIFKKSIIAKFDFIINAKSAAFILFAIFLLPGFPDDVVCYMAGLTKVPIRRLVLLFALGRFPAVVMTNYLGAGLGDNMTLVAIIALISVLIFGLAVWQRERIMRFLKKNATNSESSDSDPIKDE